MPTPTLNEFFKNRVLWKVYAIWFMRRIVPLIAVQIVFLLIALRVFANKVFVGKVLENATGAADSNLWEFIKYIFTAFFGTHTLVQIAILLGLGISSLILRDFGRALIAYLNTFRK